MIIDGKRYEKSKTEPHRFGRFVDNVEKPLGLPTMNFVGDETKAHDGIVQNLPTKAPKATKVETPLGLPSWD